MRYLLALAYACVLVGQAVAAQYDAPAPQDAKQVDAYGSEDGKVLTAVINHSIRPRVQQITGRPSAVVFLIDHAAPACERTRGAVIPTGTITHGWRDPRSQPICMFGLAEEQPTFLDEAPNNGWLHFFVREVVPSAAHRTELWASIRARNSERHVLPLSEGPNLKLIATPVIETPSGPASPIYTVFSLPGYSSAGHAVVSGFIDCGGCGGGGFHWLLEKHGTEWSVRSRFQGLRFDVAVDDFARPVLYKTPLSK